jgi:hypothetical protein
MTEKSRAEQISNHTENSQRDEKNKGKNIFIRKKRNLNNKIILLQIHGVQIQSIERIEAVNSVYS